ncbi:hypothetical protein [Kushneria aurantia]|uniref:Uncharacterized protein n=1 Tax=Kushneria aurantia TaxID=504092 RepID=A0ABV6G411_9GAMM|nr:hypothetical protein [Kushneria aurantia]
MPRQDNLSIKDKWSLDSQLGEMLRGLDQKNRAPDFAEQLTKLMQDYGMSRQDTLQIVQWIDTLS